MKIFSFTGLGTKWSVSTDGELLREEVKKAILDYANDFENRFSRFLPQSESNQFRDTISGTYRVSEEFTKLLGVADRLRALTDGVYDPAFGRLLEHAGYDKDYRMQPNNEIEDFRLPEWSLKGRELTLDGPAVFDFGGIGKGYCIDQIADILRKFEYEYFLVEGGGDMFGTTKKDGVGFRIALEWPGKPGTAFGVVELKNQAVAVSDSFKRRWGNWHHVIDPKTKKPIEAVLGCAAVSDTAFGADCMTSGLFLASENKYAELAEVFGARFIVFKKEGKVQVSAHWKGELFS